MKARSVPRLLQGGRKSTGRKLKAMAGGNSKDWAPYPNVRLSPREFSPPNRVTQGVAKPSFGIHSHNR